MRDIDTTDFIFTKMIILPEMLHTILILMYTRDPTLCFVCKWVCECAHARVIFFCSESERGRENRATLMRQAANVGNFFTLNNSARSVHAINQ